MMESSRRGMASSVLLRTTPSSTRVSGENIMRLLGIATLLGVALALYEDQAGKVDW